MNEFHLETQRLTIRNWQVSDQELFYILNSDEKVMEFFPFRRNRSQSDKLMNDLNITIRAKGYGFTAIAIKATNEPIGFCGLSDANLSEELGKQVIEIGWRLAPQFVGNGYVTEAAGALLNFGFEKMRLSEIVSFAVHNNHRSLAVMQRIGMIRVPSLDFDHPRVPDIHPHLKRHLVYCLKKPKNQV
ncbi:MAG: GNAT family N-acetyltransferase [Pseudomonadota bacterium]